MKEIIGISIVIKITPKIEALTKMSTQNRLFAWYSDKQLNCIKNTYKNEYIESKPYIYYYDMNDNIVQVTNIVSVKNGEQPKCSAKFDDLIFIGEVKRCFTTSKYPIKY